MEAGAKGVDVNDYPTYFLLRIYFVQKYDIC